MGRAAFGVYVCFRRGIIRSNIGINFGGSCFWGCLSRPVFPEWLPPLPMLVDTWSMHHSYPWQHGKAISINYACHKIKFAGEHQCQPFSVFKNCKAMVRGEGLCSLPHINFMRPKSIKKWKDLEFPTIREKHGGICSNAFVIQHGGNCVANLWCQRIS